MIASPFARGDPHELRQSALRLRHPGSRYLFRRLRHAGHRAYRQDPRAVWVGPADANRSRGPRRRGKYRYLYLRTPASGLQPGQRTGAMREAPGHVRAPAITSREIAELVESRHDNVRVTIERLVERGTIALPASQEKATGGRPSLEYVFSDEQGKRDSIVVVAQLSPEFTARLVDRWQELEKRAAAPADPMAVLSNPAAMRGLLLTYTEKVLALESEVAEQAPKVAALRLNR